MLDPIFVIHAAVTWALAGLIWAVQIVIYPQFERVGRDEFRAYHAAHIFRVTLVVGPLIFIEVVTAGWMLFAGGWRDVCFLISLPLMAVCLLSSAFIQVPQHRKLVRDGFDAAVCRRLVIWNGLRTAAWSGRAVLLALLLIF